MAYQLLDISNFNNFNKQSYEKGVLTLNLNSWSDFHDVVSVFKNNLNYIWRGQRCYSEEIKKSEDREKWKLRSTFDRKFSNESNRGESLDRILNTFKKRLKELPNAYNIDFSKNYEIWAIGQHYGLNTPLLDWTESPYIATYFAFYKIRGTKHRVVYALNRVIKRLILKEKDPKTEEVLSKQRKIEFDFDKSHFDPKHHQRLINQKGAFTKAFSGDDIKSIVKEFWEKDNREKKNYTTKAIFVEIIISDKFQDECLAALKAMNITHGTLFPDYAGAVNRS